MIDRRPLPEPTFYPPGSAGKIAELERRASLGLELWHPQDDAKPVLQVRFAETKYPPVDFDRVKQLARDAGELGIASLAALGVEGMDDQAANKKSPTQH